MKLFILLICSSLLVCLNSCKKDNNVGNIPPSVIGKWNIVSDSTYVGVGAGNHPVNYKGQTGDYFDVRTDSYIYTKEGTVLDTLSYHINSDSTIVIQSFGATVNGVAPISHIANIGLYGVSIASPKLLSPGGVYWHKIVLSRLALN
jgi:hypothetical protein